MKQPKRTQIVEWVTFIPNKGHVLTQYVNGRAVWLAGEYRGR